MAQACGRVLMWVGDYFCTSDRYLPTYLPPDSQRQHSHELWARASEWFRAVGALGSEDAHIWCGATPVFAPTMLGAPARPNARPTHLAMPAGDPAQARVPSVPLPAPL